MKDNDKWRTFHNEEKNEIEFKNPLTSSVYGLQFDKDVRWLLALQDKVENYLFNKNYSIAWHIEKTENEYCIICRIQGTYFFPRVIAHCHGSTKHKALYKCLNEIIDQIVITDN